MSEGLSSSHPPRVMLAGERGVAFTSVREALVSLGRGEALTIASEPADLERLAAFDAVVVADDRERATVECLERIARADDTVASIVVSGVDRAAPAVRALLMGAAHYLTLSELASLDQQLASAVRLTSARRRRRRLEDNRRESQRFEAVGRFAGGAAHDFNNLLTAILGYAQFASMRASHDRAMQDDLSEITRAATRAAQLTRQLVAFSRRGAEPRAPIDLGLVLKGLEPMLTRLLGERVMLAFDVQTPLPEVVSDPAELEAIVVNLVLIARDSLPLGGRVLFSARGAAREGADVELSMHLEGERVDHALLQHEFSRESLMNGEVGWLGAALVREFAHRNGGMATVRWVSAGASEVRLTMGSVVESRAPVAHAASVQEKSLGGSVILVVEDDDGVRSLARRLLEREGHEVLAVATLDEARRVWTRRHAEIALLITDIVLRHGDGASLARAFREEHPSLRVIYISGYAPGMELDAERDVTLAKPFTPDALRQTVRAVLDASRWADRESSR